MKKTLNIEIRGIGFPNKGAELMLAALIEKIKQALPNARIVLPPDAPYEQRVAYRTYQLGKLIRRGLNVASLLRCLPQKLRYLYGIVMPSEVDVVIDASGFAYGDQWGVGKAKERLSGNIAAFKQARGKRKVIMLPQAFGPFSDPAIQSAMDVILTHADLIFARDSNSMEHLKNIRASENLYQAPDFTNLFCPQYQGDFNVADFPVCFIPNAKMLEMKTSEQGSAYKNFMANLLKRTVTAGYGAFVLVHEGQGDLALAKDIISEAGVDVPLMQPSTAAEVKALIGLTKVVISSRFHGLVSGLSQGVPCLATGWSHKYQMLMNDYQQQKCLFDESLGYENAWVHLEELLSNESVYKECQHMIKTASVSQKAQIEAMWRKVIAELNDAAAA